MRYESKNKEIKGYVGNCIINVPLTISIKHQLSLTYYLVKDSFFYAGDEVLGGVSCHGEESVVSAFSEKVGMLVQRALKYFIC
jgi:hypothetical protein